MHKEEIVISPRKARTSIRTDQPGPVGNNFHNRLPSADSGIQADAGCDSLSRYRGQHFLSSTNDRDTPDSLDSESGKCSTGSSGYSTDQGSLSHAFSPTSISLASQSFSASSKPALPHKPTLTTSPSRCATTSKASSLKPTTAIKPATKVKPSSPNPSARPHDKPAVAVNSTVSININRGDSSSSGANQNSTPGARKPVANQRAKPGSIVMNRAPSKKSETDTMNSSPNVALDDKVGTLQISFSASTSNVGTTNTSSRLSSDPAVTQDMTGSSSADVSATPGTALKLQVSNPARQGQGQHDKVRSQGQGSIALTQPLKLGAAPRISIKTVEKSTPGPQPAHLVAATRPSPPDQPSSPSSRMKPKIAPRPSVISRPGPAPPPPAAAVTSCDSVTASSSLTSISAVTNHTSSSPVTSSDSVIVNPISTASSASEAAASPSTSTSTSAPETSYKPDLPVVHRIKMAGPASARREIPVTHVTHQSPSHRAHHQPRPASFAGRHTPDKQDRHTKDPIYENVRFDLRAGFDFDDADTRMRHAELILRHSDELINDALKMLGSSSAETRRNGPTRAGFSSGSRVVEGAESTPEREHRVPIFDLRTGKLHSGGGTGTHHSEGGKTGTLHSGGGTRPHRAEWSSGSTKGESKSDVSWSERMDIALSWSERKERMDTALSWLKHELTDLRDMDSLIITQFKKCQDTIEALKSQRDVWEGLSEEGEEGEYWDDLELNEFNKRYLDSPGGSSCGNFSPASREPSLPDVTSVSLAVPDLNLLQDARTMTGQQGLKQDIEATL